jgi:hypothetical protein
MKKIVITALLSSALTLTVVRLTAAREEITQKVVLENKRLIVSDRMIPLGTLRETHTRDTDQVIVFLEDCVYDRINADTGKTDRIARKAGEVLWHNKGEHAPKLVNRGAKPFRSLVIALK